MNNKHNKIKIKLKLFMFPYKIKIAVGLMGLLVEYSKLKISLHVQ